MGIARKVATKLLDEASQDIRAGQNSKRDVMSLMGVCRFCRAGLPRNFNGILVRANSGQDPKQGMSKGELISQMT